MLARVAKEREGHSSRRRKCKCVLLLLVCEWLVAQSRPKGKEEELYGRSHRTERHPVTGWSSRNSFST